MANQFLFAGMVSENKIEYRFLSGALIHSTKQIKVYRGDSELTPANIYPLGKECTCGYIELSEDLDIAGDYRVSIEGFGERTVIPTRIFDSEYFAKNYHYDGELGAIVCGSNTIFKLWAPTALEVTLNLFTQGHNEAAYKTLKMKRGDNGVWSHTEACGHGTYYTYTVVTSLGAQEAVDPYAKAAGLNGKRAMVVDLAQTDPPDWDRAALKTSIKSYSEAIIWEVHVRDFSNKIDSSRYRGKYLAFTETGLTNEHGESVGIDYLKKLGITHVHLLPVFDYATVDEANPDANFNWGYDPQNYNVPEGSYSICPQNGEERIKEFKEMVAALHAANIGVIADVVYNHTYEKNSSLNKIVPYYYYRYTESGENTSASGCGNDTASQRYMFGKFMVESAAYWIKEYKLDGLRFDLMGLHDLETMQKIERAVHAINPNAILYGEGWSMGTAMNGREPANQANISKIMPSGNAIGAVAVFNDVIRDALKGSVFSWASRGYINGSPEANLGGVIFGIRGGAGGNYGWSVQNSMVINYMSAHDNNTLWDKLLLSNPESTDDERARMNRLGAAIIMISKGIPFWQAGEEMLRTKNGVENSYNSSDDINNINWSRLRPGGYEHDTMLYYRGLIAMRKAYAIFTDNETAISNVETLENGITAITFSDKNGGEALAIINPHNVTLPYTLSGEWNLVADANRAGAEIIGRESGTVLASQIGIRVYVNNKLALYV